MSKTREHERGLVILSLDGAGIRGLSSLLILRELMTRLQRQLGLDKRPEVYEHFDIVGGTGTGGISAVMLGRLRIPLSRAIAHFAKLGEDVFSDNSFLSASNADRSIKMQQRLKGIVCEATGDENEKMMDNLSDTERCSTVVFAMATHNMNAGLPRAFRSYQGWENQMPNCAIWEALCATTAHPDMFESVIIADGSLKQPFIDGGLGCNNPLPHILSEVKLMYPTRRVGCIISIGAGHAETIQFPTASSFKFLPHNIIKAMKAIAMDSERDAQQMATRFIRTRDLYFRLNVDQGMQSVELHNWERMGEVAEHAQGYMQLAEVTKTIDRSVEAIEKKNCVFPAEDISGELPAPANQSWEEQIDARLDRLSPANDAMYNSALSATMTKRRACTANTRTEVLTNAHTWTRDDEGAKIYWMSGMAGTGKTTIAYSLCKRLEENKQLGASFFCSRDSPTCRDVTRLVPTIAYQLGRFFNLYRQVLCNVLNKDPDVVHKDLETQFENLIAKPLEGLKKDMPTDMVVVIDALDECADVNGTQKILNMLFRYTTRLSMKFFVTSRPEPIITSTMTQQGPDSRSILHLHNIEQSLVEADIRTYLTEELNPIKPRPEQIERLVARAGLLFIFAATVVRYISPNDTTADHEERLSAMLEASANHNADYEVIDALYKMILSKALVEGKPKGNERHIRRLVLWTVVCAREPMTIPALAEVLGIDNKRRVEVAIQPLQSVLHVSESSEVVSTLHASFSEFLLSAGRAGSLLYCHETEHNEHLATRCFEVMKRTLRFNICGLETSFRFDKDVPNLQNRVDNAISMGLFYACRYWGDHLVGAATPNILVPHLDEFLRYRLLFWMEVMNLKGWIDHGEGVLSQVLSWLPTYHTSTNLRQFAYDARNFVTTIAASSCSLSTPHIYLSMLSFTPTQSLVRTNYLPRTRGLLRVEGTGMEARRRAPLATWNVGSKVVSLAQSGDGKRIVSGCIDGTVSIWDVTKGARIVGPLRSGEGGDWGWELGSRISYGPPVAFSRDGTRIASGSRDRTILLWDAHNGNPITDPITTSTGPIHSVAFSPDGTRLISGSQDRTIRMWDARNGISLGNTFQGHQRAVLSVVFSPDGKRIASGSSDRTVRIWDVDSATTIVGPLEGHKRPVRSVAFSPDGLRVLSVSDEYPIRIWDVQNGTILVDLFRDHINYASAVAFSPDGARVVSSPVLGCSIYIWDARNSALITGPLDGHCDGVSSVLFSPDGTRILSGSFDGTIRIWDAHHGATAAAEPTGHTNRINSVAFSPDGTRAVSGSADRTIRIWDTRDGRLVVRPLEGHTDGVSSVAFSPDGARIVSSSYDHTIRTWDARSGTYVGSSHRLLLPSSIRQSIPFIGVPFKGHTGSVFSVAYSPDGSRIASCGEHTIRVWNSRTGKPVAEPFMGHTGWVWSVAWSPDGTRIASGSSDEMVRMWLAHNGTSLWASHAHSDVVICIAYSPDGTQVVSGSADCTILVLKALDGSVLHGPFKGHTDKIMSVAFSPDGTRIVSGSWDYTVCVWDAQKGTVVSGPFKGHTGWIRSVAFSPDSRRVVSCSDDETIRFWEAATADNPRPTYFDQCTLRDDGWVTYSHSQLLMWLPPELRTAIPPPCSLIISPQGVIRVDDSDMIVGECWTKCYSDSATRSVAY